MRAINWGRFSSVAEVLCGVFGLSRADAAQKRHAVKYRHPGKNGQSFPRTRLARVRNRLGSQRTASATVCRWRFTALLLGQSFWWLWKMTWAPRARRKKQNSK